MDTTPHVQPSSIELAVRPKPAGASGISSSAGPGPAPSGDRSPVVAPRLASRRSGSANITAARSLEHLSPQLQAKWRIALTEMRADHGGPTAAAKALIKESMENFPKDADLRKLYVYIGRNRPVDLDGTAALLTSVRGAAYHKDLAAGSTKSAEQVAVDVKALVKDSTTIFEQTLATHYLDAATTGEHILATASRSGTSYVAPAWISTILLYHVVPLLAAAHPRVGFAALQLVAALQFLLLAKKQQSMAVLPNELVQSKGSAKVETASTVKYKMLQGQSAVLVNEKAREIREAGSQFKDVAEARALVDTATRKVCGHLDEMLSELTPDELIELHSAASQFIDVKLDGSRTQLAHETTEGGHLRQDVGQYYRSMVGVARPIVTLLPTLLQYVPAYAEAMGAWSAAGLTMGIADIAQGVAHVASRADERNKVKMKPVLNALAAPAIAREGEIGLMKGEPLRAEHIEEDEWRKLLPNPSQSMSARIAKALARDLQAPGITPAEAAQLRIQIDKVKAGDIGSRTTGRR